VFVLICITVFDSNKKSSPRLQNMNINVHGLLALALPMAPIRANGPLPGSHVYFVQLNKKNYPAWAKKAVGH